MDPIKTTDSNCIFHPPEGMENCDPLYVKREEDGRHVSVWEPSDLERQAIASGANVELHIWTMQPPVAVIVTNLRKVP